jgi:hypothetical protein
MLLAYCIQTASEALQPGPCAKPPRTQSLSAAGRCDLQYEGFKACFGGEELKRACATLSGALVTNKQVRAAA